MGELIFSGASTLKLDSKQRIPIPAGFRTELAKGMSDEARAAAPRDETGAIKGFGWLTVVLLPDFSEKGAIDGFAHSMLREMAENLNRAERTGKNVSKLRQRIFGAARQVGLDDAGRIVLRQDVQQAAGLDGEAHVVGLGNKFQIWNPDRFEEVHGATEDETGFDAYLDVLAMNAGDAG